MLAILRDVTGVARLIRRHPLITTGADRRRAFRRFLAWQLAGRAHGGALSMDFVNHTRLLVKRHLGGRLHYVLGLAEFDDMAFVAHVLRPGELFADVGANIGAYTLMAAACGGAKVVAFEPAERAARYLTDNVALNGLQARVEICRKAVGATPGTIALTAGMGEINHVLLTDETAETVQVDVVTLDGFFAGREPPAVVKIDVEGFETEVMRGAARLLAARQPLAFLIELAGLGARYGHDEGAVRAELAKHGYIACAYQGMARKLTRLAERGNGRDSSNALYVRDFDELQARLQSAPPFALNDRSI